MAVVIELVDSREITNTSSKFHYMAKDYSDEGAALTAVLGVAPSSDRGLYRTAYNVKPLGAGLFDVQVDFGIFSTDTGQQSVSFEIVGQNTHITHSRNTTAYAPSGETAPDQSGAIGVSADGKKVDGVDILKPTFSLSVTQIVAATTVNSSYIASLNNLVGKTNNGVFTVAGCNFPRGEILYQGVRGSRRGTDSWELSHSFLGSKNQSGISIGSITGIAKWGWQYLWVLYDQTDDGTANAIVSKPRAVYVESVYEEADLSTLGIT